MNYSHSRSRNSADGDYFFCVEGLPAYYTWEMLKDLARKAATYPGWTEMASNPRGIQKGRGWVKVKRPKDAYNLYGFFTNGPTSLRPLKVYLWSTAKSPPELLKCNCDIPRQAPTFPYQHTTNIYDAPPHNSPTFGTPPIAPKRSVPSQPTYVYAQNNRPVNATGGLVKTESRGIFISKLNMEIDHKQLEEYLSRIVMFESCNIWKDASTGRSRGIATAKFATMEAAAAAIRVINGQNLMSKTIKVRLDMEAETVTPNAGKDLRDGPIIANGSK